MAAGFVAALQKKRYRCSAVEADKVNGFHQVKMQEKEARMTEIMLLWFFERLCSFLLNLPYPKRKMRKMVFMLTKNNQPNCPQLYLYSTADNVVPFKSIELLIEEQRKMGRYVSSFNFESSPHVDHYRTFPHVYLRELDNFFNQCFASTEQFNN